MKTAIRLFGGSVQCALAILLAWMHQEWPWYMALGLCLLYNSGWKAITNK